MSNRQSDTLSDRERLIIEARSAEAQALFRAGRSWLELTVRMLGVGVTLIAAAASIGLVNHKEEVLLAVPAALALLFTYQLQVYADVIAMGVTRRELERVLAEDLGAEALAYETYAAPLRHGRHNPSVLATQLFYAALIVGAGIAGGFEASGNTVRELIYYGATGTSVILVLLAWIDMAKTWKRAEASVAGALSSVVPCDEATNAQGTRGR